MTGRKIIIGDIHGCLKTFDSLINRLALTAEDQLYLLGDYIDRGPDSKGVLDRILKLQKAPFQLVTLRGNHEQSLLFDHHSETVKGWYSMADDEFLKSFGIENLKGLPEEYITLCNSFPLFHEEEDFFLVHAGINFKTENPLEDQENLLWIRDWYKDLDREWLGNRLLIHGHTPLTKHEIKKQFSELSELPILNIDCGACFYDQQQHGLGYLCAFDFNNHELFFEENIDGPGW